MADRAQLITTMADSLDAISQASQDAGGAYFGGVLAGHIATLETDFPDHLPTSGNGYIASPSDVAGYHNGAQVSLGASVTEIFEDNSWRPEFLGAIADAILLQSALDPHPAVRVATTGNITLSGTQTIDGIAVNIGDRVGVKNQTTGSQNGIYIVAAGAWTRATDMDATGELLFNSFYAILEGTANEDSSWICSTPNPITLGTTATTWQLFQGPLVLTAGAGLVRVGNAFNIGAGTGITVNADDIQISATYAGQGSITTVGTLSSGTWHAGVIGPVYGGTGQNGYAMGDILYSDATDSLARLPGNTTATKKFLRQTGTGSVSAAPAWDTLVDADIPGTLVRTSTTWNTTAPLSGGGDFSAGRTLSIGGLSSLGAGNQLVGVNAAGSGWEYKTLSGAASRVTVTHGTGTIAWDISASYAGQASIVTVGTITSGVWNGAAIGLTAGGTGLTTYALGDLLYASVPNVLATLGGNTSVTKKFLTQTGTGTASAAPAWDILADADIPGTLVRTSLTISTTGPLTGGGDLSANRTFAISGLSTVGAANQIPGTNAGATAWEYKTFAGTSARLTVVHSAGGVTWDISGSYVGQASITTVGTIGSGTWQGGSISTTYTDAKIKTVAGTTDKITIGGTSTDPTFTIAATYAGQSSITTVGTLAAGTWNAGTIGVTWGGTGAATLASNAVLYGNGTSPMQALAVNASATNKFLTQSSSGAPAWATLVNGDVPTALTGKTYNGLTLTAASVGFTIAGGTTSKTLTVALDASVSGTNTGDQTITLTGDVTGSGTGSFATTIGAARVTSAMLRNSAALSVIGRSANSSGVPADISTTAGSGLFLRETGSTIAFGAIVAADLPGAFAGFANPTASIGLSAVNGSAATAMRSDGAPALSQSIAPTWSGAHQFNAVTTFNQAVAFLALNGTGGDGRIWYNTTGGLIIQGLTGSPNDFSIRAVGGNSIIRNPTGTLQVVFGGAVSMDSTLTVTGAITGSNLSGTNTGDQTITLTGAVTGSGTGSFSTTLATVSEVKGGTGQTTYTLGDTLYSSASNTLSKLAGNTTTTKKFLRQTGNGSISAAPAWDTIAASDLPGSFAGFANPSVSIGLTAVNGSAATAMRSDAAPALSQSISPTWTNQHAFDKGFAFSDVTGTSAAGMLLRTAAQGLIVRGINGSTNALSVQAADGTVMMRNPQGTVGLTFDVNATYTTNIIKDVIAGAQNDFFWYSSGVQQWALRVDTTNHDWSLRAHDNSGVFIDQPFSVARASGGLVTVARPGYFTTTIGVGIAFTGGNAGIIVGSTNLITASQYGIYSNPTFTPVATTQGTAIWAGYATANGTSIPWGAGLYVANPFKNGTSSIGTNYAIFVDDQTRGGINYSWYSGVGLAKFGDRVSITGNTNLLTSGSSLELAYDQVNNLGVVAPYNRSGAAYRDLWLKGRNLVLHTSDTPALSIDTNANLLMGNKITNDLSYVNAVYNVQASSGAYFQANDGGTINIRLAPTGHANPYNYFRRGVMIGGDDVIPLNGDFEVREGTSSGVIAAFGNTTSVNAAYPAYIYFSNTNTINFGYNVNGIAYGYVNWVGYLNSTSQFRNFRIGDGKQNVIAEFNGSGAGLQIGGTFGSLSSNTTLQLGGATAQITFGSAVAESGPYTIGVLGSGGATPASKGTGYGRNLIIVAGGSDNTAGKAGGDLYLRGGAPTAPATVYGSIYLGDQGGNVCIGSNIPNSKLHVDGSFGTTTLTSASTSALTLDGTHRTVIFTASGTKQITLPLASSCIGRIYYLVVAGLGNIGVNLSGSDSLSWGSVSGVGTPIYTLPYTTGSGAVVFVQAIQATGTGKWTVIETGVTT